MNEFSLIAMMALVTFVPRYLPFALAGRVQLPPIVEETLNFVPIAVLTAIIAQASLYRGGELSLSLDNHHALAALAAFATAVITRHLFVTIAIGLTCFTLLKLF
ncbi:MAG: branched-subunit amino acid transport protein [Halieaceae bacterium]